MTKEAINEELQNAMKRTRQLSSKITDMIKTAPTVANRNSLTRDELLLAEGELCEIRENLITINDLLGELA